MADEAVQVAVHRGRTHRVDLGVQWRGGAGEPLGCELGGELLQYGTHRVALGDLVGAHRPHSCAAEGLGLDEPQDLELAQRLAHRRLADTELLGDPQLDDALARLVVALDDALHEDVLDLVAKDRAVHRHGGRSRRRSVMATAVGRAARVSRVTAGARTRPLARGSSRHDAGCRERERHNSAQACDVHRCRNIIDYVRCAAAVTWDDRRRLDVDAIHRAARGPVVMRALVVTAPDDFAVRDVDRPRPGPFELLCRVRVAAICGTDPHIIQGHYPGFWPKDWPLIPGHEWCGDVVELGEGAEALGWKVGIRVAGTSHAPCGYCPRCIEGRYNICENFGVEGLHAQYGHNAPGAYAEYVVHSVRSVFPVPDELTDEEAAMVDPAGDRAAHRRARRPPTGRHRRRRRPGRHGPARRRMRTRPRRRARRRRRPRRRLQKALDLGHEAVDFTAGDPVEAVRAATGGAGADVALECSGAPEALGPVRGHGAKGRPRRGHRHSAGGRTLPMPRTVLDEIDVVGVRARRARCRGRSSWRPRAASGCAS